MYCLQNQIKRFHCTQEQRKLFAFEKVTVQDKEPFDARILYE
jgi:hypothetical protein